MDTNKKVVLVGTGFVGMSFAYSLFNQGGANELVLIDVLKEKAQGEALDLAHGIAYAPSKMEIKYGEYDECKDANIVVITAGIAQKQGGQTRLELVDTNSKIMKSVVENLKSTDFIHLKIGTGKPQNGEDLIEYVIGKLSQAEYANLVTAIDLGTLAVEKVLEDGIDKAMNVINAKGA